MLNTKFWGIWEKMAGIQFFFVHFFRQHTFCLEKVLNTSKVMARKLCVKFSVNRQIIWNY
jgi:hypothetical protein